MSKVAAKKAVEVCQHCELNEPAKGLLQEHHTPAQFLQLLIDKQMYQDAVRFLAFGLPPREAVGWACLCAQKWIGTVEAKDEVRAALDAAKKWVAEPSDENRRDCMAKAQVAELGNPAGCTAAAVFFTEGSIAPPEAPEVPPPEGVVAKMVAAAIQFAALLKEPEKAAEKYQDFLSAGLRVAEGPPAAT